MLGWIQVSSNLIVLDQRGIKVASVPIQDILGRAGWSSSRTFDKFYNKPVYSKDSSATAILYS